MRLHPAPQTWITLADLRPQYKRCSPKSSRTMRRSSQSAPASRSLTGTLSRQPRRPRALTLTGSLLAFAETARIYSWNRPVMTDEIWTEITACVPPLCCERRG